MRQLAFVMGTSAWLETKRVITALETTRMINLCCNNLNLNLKILLILSNVRRSKVVFIYTYSMEFINESVQNHHRGET